jgi:Zn-dependent peptidase ImmA (M78 family)
MTATALAERVGVTPSAISQWESDVGRPGSDTALRLADALAVPHSFFLRPFSVEKTAPVRFRRYASASKRDVLAAVERMNWLREVYAELERFVTFPPPNVPDLSRGRKPGAITPDEVEQAAGDVRRAWGFGDGPISNTVHLAESVGIAVGCFVFSATMDAFSQAPEGRPFIIMNAERVSAARLRFDLAHELGHLVLHRHVPAQESNEISTYKLMEEQAHRFAAAFLCPARSFCDEVHTVHLDTLVRVKARWRVSVQMMIRRALDLEIVSESQAKRARIELSARGWRTREPLDDELPVEQPVARRRAVELLIQRKVLTVEDLKFIVPLLPRELEVLIGLPNGFLDSPTWGEVVELKPNTAGPAPVFGRDAEVVEFKRPNK